MMMRIPSVARRVEFAAAFLVSTLVLGCAPLQKFSPAAEHLATPTNRPEIPKPVGRVLTPPAPVARLPQDTYTVVVTAVPVKDVLFALARDAKVNIDVQGDIAGTVTMNAIDQTLPQLLDRISKQVDMRYSIADGTISVGPDVANWRNYDVDYVNLARNSEAEVSVATQVRSTGTGVEQSGGSGGGSAGGGSGGGEQGNVSRTTVKSTGDNGFWATLASNVRQLITGRSQNSDSAASGGDPVVVNPMAGVISVSATQRQHREVQQFLDNVSRNAKRQVMVEVTVVEIDLNDAYQAGVDWSRVSAQAGDGKNGVSFFSSLTGNNLEAAPFFAMTYNNFDADGSGYSAALRALEQFGDAKVLSSPRIMALNNQTAMLKVVDERVYFSLEAETIDGSGNGDPDRTIVTSEIRTVPVGFVMSVTPQINQNGNVSLNVRPTLTRILRFVVDPAPRLFDTGTGAPDFDNLVPEIHVNELESLLEVADGQTIVIGGLMQDRIDKKKDAIPGLSRLPGIGKLFTYRDEEVAKSEFVLFLRPTVIRGAGTGAASAGRSRHLDSDPGTEALAATAGDLR